MRFEPNGMTNDPDIRAAKSIVDYIFRWMGKKSLTVDQQEEIGTVSVSCGRSKYLQPIRPLVTSMARARALTLQPSQTSVFVPHLFGGIIAYKQATRTLACAR